MKITPKTDKEIAEANLWAAGIYGFEIATAEETISKSGNEMIKLALNVYDDKGNSKVLFDYLLDTIPGKIKHLADICNLSIQYNDGNLQAFDLMGKKGLLKLIIQKDKSGQYADKNSIIDYITEEKQTNNEIPAGNPILDDEIPF